MCVFWDQANGGPQEIRYIGDPFYTYNKYMFENGGTNKLHRLY